MVDQELLTAQKCATGCRVQRGASVCIHSVDITAVFEEELDDVLAFRPVANNNIESHSNGTMQWGALVFIASVDISAVCEQELGNVFSPEKGRHMQRCLVVSVPNVDVDDTCPVIQKLLDRIDMPSGRLVVDGHSRF